MSQGVRIVFHSGNATPVPVLQKAGWQLIALPGCRSTDQYSQYRPIERAGKGSRAEETRDRKAGGTFGGVEQTTRGPRPGKPGRGPLIVMGFDGVAGVDPRTTAPHKAAVGRG